MPQQDDPRKQETRPIFVSPDATRRARLERLREKHGVAGARVPLAALAGRCVDLGLDALERAEAAEATTSTPPPRAA